MDAFAEQYRAFLAEFGAGRKMVLSTAENGSVSSRMMSVVQISGAFFFQTDRTLRKYRQLTRNPQIALCIDNIQIEGVCAELGHPLDHAAFAAAFRQQFRGSFDAYTALKNERLFTVRPTFIERWIYRDAVPYIERFDIEHQQYSLAAYQGE